MKDLLPKTLLIATIIVFGFVIYTAIKTPYKCAKYVKKTRTVPAYGKHSLFGGYYKGEHEEIYYECELIKLK